MVKEFVWEKGAGWQAISPLLFSFLVLIKCQVLNLRVGRPHDQVLQRDFTISYSLEIQLLLCYNNNNNNTLFVPYTVHTLCGINNNLLATVCGLATLCY